MTPCQSQTAVIVCSMCLCFQTQSVLRGSVPMFSPVMAAPVLSLTQNVVCVKLEEKRRYLTEHSFSDTTFNRT